MPDTALSFAATARSTVWPRSLPSRLKLSPLPANFVQRAIGIPVSLFTAIFALARTVGWIAQWNEMISDPDQKIGRPRQLYTGAPRRDVKPIAQR